MYCNFDSNTGYLVTYSVSQLNIDLKDEELKIYSYFNKKFFIQQPRFIREVNKKDIFDDLYKISIIIAKELKNLKFIGFEKGRKALFNITPQDILGSERIVDRIKNFVNTYGFSESEEGPRIDILYQANDNNDKYNGIFDSEPNPLLNSEPKPLLDLIPIPRALQSLITDEMLKKNSIRCELDVMTFVNLCLMIYFIKRFKYGIEKSEISTILNLSDIFTDLKSHYGIGKENKKSYNVDKRNNVIKYLLKLQHITSCYINTYFKYQNFERIVYPNLDELINGSDLYDTNNIEKLFSLKLYIIRTPILAAYDYLLQTLTTKSTITIECDNCGKRLLIKESLCYDCKLEFYTQVIEKYERNNNSKLEELQIEMEQFVEESKSTLIPSRTPLIDKIYLDRKKQKKYDQNKKDCSNQS